MKLLLDTHIWVWAVASPEKLGRSVKRQLGNPKNELYLSPISIWEAQLVAKRGKLKTKLRFSAWLTAALTDVPLREAPFDFAVAAEASGMRLPQSDFGDLIVAATASVHGLTLVTADDQLINYAAIKTLANH
jgi:PIN domain nuclease of toxin-antitoxin system